MSLAHAPGHPSWRIDPELGPEKRCNVCGDWWPVGEEFWYVKRYEVGDTAYAGGKPYVRQTAGVHVQSRCKACWAERSAARYRARRGSDA